MGRGRDVVSEAEPVVVAAEVHVQETLVSAIERDATPSHGHHGLVILHVGGQDHDTGVEEVWPANIWGGRERAGNVKELLGSTVGNNIGINVDDLGELGLLPQVDLGKGRVQIGTVHKREVCRVDIVSNSGNGQDIVVDRLE